MVLSSYFNDISYADNIRYKETHPPWYIHLLYSDMISGVLDYEMNRCFEMNQDVKVQSEVMNKNDMSFQKLKAPYLEVPVCKDVTDVSSHQLFLPSNTKDGGGSVTRSSPSSWKYYEDVAEKPGLEISYNLLS